MKLHEITAAISNFRAMMEDEELDAQVVEDTLESLEDTLEGKVESLSFIYRQMGADAEFYKAEEERLSKKRKVIEARRERLKQYLAEQLEIAGRDEVKTATAKVVFQVNPPSVYIEDEEKIPPLYVRYVRSVDKKALLQALKNGEAIEGAALHREKSLRVK